MSPPTGIHHTRQEDRVIHDPDPEGRGSGRHRDLDHPIVGDGDLSAKEQGVPQCWIELKAEPAFRDVRAGPGPNVFVVYGASVEAARVRWLCPPEQPYRLPAPTRARCWQRSEHASRPAPSSALRPQLEDNHRGGLSLRSPIGPALPPRWHSEPRLDGDGGPRADAGSQAWVLAGALKYRSTSLSYLSWMGGRCPARRGSRS